MSVLTPAGYPAARSVKGFHVFVGTHSGGTVALCNKVFPIVLSRPGLCCRAPRLKKSHSSTPAQLTSQHKRRCYFREKRTKSANHYSQLGADATRTVRGGARGVTDWEGSGPCSGFQSGWDGSCLEFLRETAGLSVLQRLQLVELATPCTNIEDLKTLITVYSSCSRECLISEVSKILPLSDINLAWLLLVFVFFLVWVVDEIGYSSKYMKT